MTSTEQKELDNLREELESAKASADEMKAYSNSVVERLNGELRLYRGLFWCILAFALVTGLLHLLQR
jgi:hypothetical protein